MSKANDKGAAQPAPYASARGALSTRFRTRSLSIRGTEKPRDNERVLHELVGAGGLTIVAAGNDLENGAVEFLEDTGHTGQ